MKDDLKRVEGYNNLYRNKKGAIVSTDTESYQAYKRRSASFKKKEHRVVSLEEELINAKKEIEELKEMVKAFLNK